MGRNDTPADLRSMGQAMQLLGITSQLYAQRMEALLSPDDLTLAQFSMLVHLSRQTRPQRVSDIARAMGANQPFVTKSLTKFDGLGLLDTTGDPDDRRSRCVKLNPSGHARLGEIRGRLAPDVGTLFDGWSEKDVNRLIKALGRLAQWFEANRP
jgi:DNA-binding MarR family transcriptional regulator